MEVLWDFFLLRDPNVRWVVVAVALMGTSSAVVGCFTYLRKRALVGDVVSHAVLPGICLAFMLTHTKNPVWLLVGAFVTGWIGLWSVDWVTRHTKLKTDAALGLVLSTFYGFGALLLTSIQSSGEAGQSGLDKFLFGNAAAMVTEDVMVFSIFSLLLLLLIIVFFKSFQMVSFDRVYALTKGLPVKKIELLLSILTVLSIALGIQAVGVVLMAALLITPAAAARYWTDNLAVMTTLAALIAVFSSISGTFVSYLAPQMPTGPWIVMFLSIAAVFSVLLGLRKGVLYKWFQKRRNRQKILGENILKCIYHLGEIDGDFKAFRAFDEITQKRGWRGKYFKRGLMQLQKAQMLKVSGKNVAFTDKGWEEGRRITRIHRLWEIYLTKYLQLPADHVHDDAEAIEHIITPEIEKELEAKLSYPLIDPHDSPVPYDKQ